MVNRFLLAAALLFTHTPSFGHRPDNKQAQDKAQTQRFAAYATELPDILVQPASLQPVPRADAAYWHDSVPEAMRQSYIAYGEQYLGKPFAALPLSVFAQFKETGNRVGYEQLSFARRQQLAAIVMAEIMEGQGRFLPDIVNGIGAMCEETWWGIPAHYSQKVPQREDQTVDLFNAESASLMAWTVYMLRPQLDRFSPLLTRHVEREIDRRILQPALTTNYWWKRGGMNWNPWICSNWLTCILLYEHDRQRQIDGVSQILSAMDAFVNSYPADGGCDEGPDYWDRAAASLFEVLRLLKMSTKGRIDLSADPKIQAMGSYVYKTYIGSGYQVNFADAHNNRLMQQVNIVYPFARYLHNKDMEQLADFIAQEKSFFTNPAGLYEHSGNFPTLGRELLFLAESPLPTPQTDTGSHSRKVVRQGGSFYWLPDLQVMTARRGNLFVAMKGGNNGESHNHNDVGSFIVYADTAQSSSQTGTMAKSPSYIPLFIDPGVGEYTAKTFSADRYSIWTMQSAYHNLPQINGTDQRDGKQYGAQVVTYKPGLLCLQIAGAYPPEARVDSWQRTLSLSLNALTITEDYTLFQGRTEEAPQTEGKANKGATRLMLLTICQPRISQAGSISVASYQLTYNPRQLDASVEDISSLLDTHLQGVWGEHMYRIVLTVKNQKAKDKIVYRLLPAGKKK